MPQKSAIARGAIADSIVKTISDHSAHAQGILVNLSHLLRLRSKFDCRHVEIMKSSTTSSAKTCTPVARRRRADRGISLDEMRRLMDVYGPIKCLRKRQGTGDGENAKTESIKRKFYRWFPDLDERFEKTEAGIFAPKFGHEVELSYRSDMRKKNGKTLSSKRNRCRQLRYGGSARKKSSSSKAKAALARAECESVSLALVSQNAPSLIPYTDEENELKLEFGDRQPSSDIAADIETLNSSFKAEEAIFDDVDVDFFGPMVQNYPGVTAASFISEEQGSDSSWEDDLPVLTDMLNKSMQECFEEMLGSDYSATVPDFFVDMIST